MKYCGPHSHTASSVFLILVLSYHLFLLWKTFKPIFHWKQRLCWLPNANEIDRNNMKCTCPTQDFYVGDPTQPLFHWLALGFCVRANANFKFCVGGDANLRVCVGSMLPTCLCWYPQCKILASGALPNANPPTPGIFRRSGI